MMGVSTLTLHEVQRCRVPNSKRLDSSAPRRGRRLVGAASEEPPDMHTADCGCITCKRIPLFRRVRFEWDRWDPDWGQHSTSGLEEIQSESEEGLEGEGSEGNESEESGSEGYEDAEDEGSG